MFYKNHLDIKRRSTIPNKQRYIHYVCVCLLNLMLWGVGCQSLPSTPPPPAPTPLPTQTITNPQSSTVRLATGEWVPYMGQDLPHYGCDLWIIEEAFAIAGFEVEYGFFPWARSRHLSEDGEWDGTATWSTHSELVETHYYSAEFITRQEWVFFYRKDEPFEWETIDDLTDKIIGLTIGYSYSGRFEEAQATGALTIDEAPNDDLNFAKLLAGRIDIFPIDRNVGYAVLAENFTAEEQTRLAVHPQPLSTLLSYLLLSKAVPQSEERMVAFNQGLQRLRTSGRYAEILEACLPQKD